VDLDVCADYDCMTKSDDGCVDVDDVSSHVLHVEQPGSVVSADSGSSVVSGGGDVEKFGCPVASEGRWCRRYKAEDAGAQSSKVFLPAPAVTSRVLSRISAPTSQECIRCSPRGSTRIQAVGTLEKLARALWVPEKRSLEHVLDTVDGRDVGLVADFADDESSSDAEMGPRAKGILARAKKRRRLAVGLVRDGDNGESLLEQRQLRDGAKAVYSLHLRGVMRDWSRSPSRISSDEDVDAKIVHRLNTLFFKGLDVGAGGKTVASFV